jgi:CRP-like cAMP-binding protein
MPMAAPTGRGARSDRRQRRIGGLASRLNGSRRRYEWLVKAFPHAPAPLLTEATSRLRRTRYRPGDVIVAEGEPADRFYIVTSGEAEVIQRVENRDVYVSTVAPGQYFGEVGLLASRPRNATVRAVSDLEVLSLDKETFRRVADHSETAEHLEQVLVVRSARSTPRDDAAPLPPWTRLVQRLFKHPRLMHYNRLIILVMALNAVVVWYGVSRHWWSNRGIDLAAIALVAQANLAFAIVMRQSYVINFLGWMATRAPTTWPLRLRWMLGKWFHFGGLHVGAAMAGTLWYGAFLGSLTYDLARGPVKVPIAVVAVFYVVAALFVAIIIMALPRFRTATHDKFEFTHRFFGWASLLFVSGNTVLFVASQRGSHSLASAVLTAPGVWVLVATIACGVWPWMLLRKVRISVDRPSAHTAVVTLSHGVNPGIGTTRPISRSPIVQWHHFAILPASDGSKSYRMVISRAGDWTSAFIDDPPQEVWVRGIPTVGMAIVRRLFTKVIFVATGSGIGPTLPHLLTGPAPSRLVWVTKDPRLTYGDALVDEIREAQPDAIIWNTDKRGKPDVLRLAYAAYLDSKAEAVVCISNSRVTWHVVNGLERRGIPAFGPIWDS